LQVGHCNPYAASLSLPTDTQKSQILTKLILLGNEAPRRKERGINSAQSCKSERPRD